MLSTTSFVADELKKISDIIESRAQELCHKERLFKEKVKNFELWKQKTYDALKRHAQTLFADAVQRLKEVSNLQAQKIQSVLNTSEAVMRLCAQQKEELERCSRSATGLEKTLRMYKARFTSEQQRGRAIQKKLTAVERVNAQLRKQLDSNEARESTRVDKKDEDCFSTGTTELPHDESRQSTTSVIYPSSCCNATQCDIALVTAKSCAYDNLGNPTRHAPALRCHSTLLSASSKENTTSSFPAAVPKMNSCALGASQNCTQSTFPSSHNLNEVDAEENRRQSFAPPRHVIQQPPRGCCCCSSKSKTSQAPTVVSLLPTTPGDTQTMSSCASTPNVNTAVTVSQERNQDSLRRPQLPHYTFSVNSSDPPTLLPSNNTFLGRSCSVFNHNGVVNAPLAPSRSHSAAVLLGTQAEANKKLLPLVESYAKASERGAGFDGSQKERFYARGCCPFTGAVPINAALEPRLGEATCCLHKVTPPKAPRLFVEQDEQKESSQKSVSKKPVSQNVTSTWRHQNAQSGGTSSLSVVNLFEQPGANVNANKNPSSFRLPVLCTTPERSAQVGTPTVPSQNTSLAASLLGCSHNMDSLKKLTMSSSSSASRLPENYKLISPTRVSRQPKSVLPLVDSERQVVESAGILRKLAERIEIKKLLQPQNSVNKNEKFFHVQNSPSSRSIVTGY